MKQASVSHACSFIHTALQLQMGSGHWAMGWQLLTEPRWKEKVKLEGNFHVISGLGYDSDGATE